MNSEVLISNKHISSAFRCGIISQPLKLSEFSSDWKIAYVIPVYKTGDSHLISDYRHISVTSVSSELIQYILYSRLI